MLAIPFLVLCFQVSPCRCEFATYRHLSLQANRRQRPTHTIEGDILYLVVVGDIWRSRGVGETILCFSPLVPAPGISAGLMT